MTKMRVMVVRVVQREVATGTAVRGRGTAASDRGTAGRGRRIAGRGIEEL